MGTEADVVGANNGVDKETRTWSMWVHFSLLAGIVVPLAGLILPIILWQVKRDDLPGIDPHGKNAVNWLISYAIYLVGAFALCFVVVGVPIVIALGVIGIVFPIIAGIKANEGKLWSYPLSITFVS